MLHQPTKVTRMTLIMELSLIEPTDSPKQVHQSTQSIMDVWTKLINARSLATICVETFQRLVGPIRVSQLAVDTPDQKGSFTRDRWTQLTLLVNNTTHTTLKATCQHSVSSVNPLFSSVSKRARESFAASEKRKKKPVHSTSVIVRKLNDKGADMDCQAVLPPDYEPEGDSKREELWSARPTHFTITVTGASSKLLATRGEWSSIPKP